MRPTVTDSPSGIVLLNKEPGQTSFQALYPVKRLYGQTVGHTGTLDKFAEGLLVVLVGKFTKFNQLFTAFDKVYEADFTFGTETSTLDPEGEVIFRGSEPGNEIPGLSERWVGPQMQVPPEFSAIHIQGKRASDRMRDGQKVIMEARPIVVHSLEVEAWKPPVLTVRIHCSKGTYVRSIARDWGRASGAGAHVTRLRRLSVGPFELGIQPSVFQDAPWTLQTLGIPVITVEEQQIALILNGRDPRISVPDLAVLASERAGLQDSRRRLLAVVEKSNGAWKYLFVDRGFQQ